MKIVKLILFLFILSFAVKSKAQTADEIVDKHINAIGGKDAWKKVNALKQTGTINVQGNEVAVTMTVLNGKGLRQDISLMGMNGYTILTPTEGWNYMPFQGQQKPEAMTADDVKQSIDQLDTQGELLDYKTKGHSVEYLGKDDVDGTEAYKLKLISKSGTSKTVYIDPASYYIIRVVRTTKANGQEAQVTTNLSNYEKLPEGIVVPKKIQLSIGELKITKVEVNPAVDDNVFKPDTK